jgi:hypothetical protein
VNTSEEKIVGLVKSYKQVFASPEGKKVLEHLIRTYMLKTSHVEGDPYSTAFNEGARNVLLFILHKVRVSIPELEAMLTYSEEEEDV